MVGCASGPHTSEKLMDGRPPPSEVAHQVGQLAHARAARWFHLHRARLEEDLRESRAVTYPVTYDRELWLLRGVHSRGASAQGSCICMCCKDPTRRGQQGERTCTCSTAFIRPAGRKQRRPEATFPSARARERLAKAGSVVLDAIFDEDHDGAVAESSFSSRPPAPRMR